jgi:hypothetical protein
VRRSGIVILWAVALVVTTAITWQIVSAAGQSINEESGAPLNVGPPGSSATSTSTASLPASSTTVTAETSSTGATTPEVTTPRETVVIPTVGGTVTIGVGGGAVTYLSAVPAAGFALEIDDPGPPRVRVEFESDETKVEVRAEWVDGALDVDVDTDD